MAGSFSTSSANPSSVRNVSSSSPESLSESSSAVSSIDVGVVDSSCVVSVGGGIDCTSVGVALVDTDSGIDMGGLVFSLSSVTTFVIFLGGGSIPLDFDFLDLVAFPHFSLFQTRVETTSH